MHDTRYRWATNVMTSVQLENHHDCAVNADALLLAAAACSGSGDRVHLYHHHNDQFY